MNLGKAHFFLFQHIPAVFGCIGDQMGGYIWGPEVWDPPSWVWRFGEMFETRCLWQSLVLVLPCETWVKIRYPNNWMVNTKLIHFDPHPCETWYSSFLFEFQFAPRTVRLVARLEVRYHLWDPAEMLVAASWPRFNVESGQDAHCTSSTQELSITLEAGLWEQDLGSLLDMWNPMRLQGYLDQCKAGLF